MMSGRDDAMTESSDTGPAQRSRDDGHGTRGHREVVGVGRILRVAAREARRDTLPILAVAITVSLITAVVEVVVDHYVDPNNNALSAAGSISAEGVSLLGTVLLAGFLCRLISSAEHGGEDATLGHVIRSLPWIRLLVADIVVTLLVVGGLILLVLPGLLVLNLLAVTGPVIEIEERSVRGALRRSAHLVRRHFWTVGLLATVPLIIEGEIESFLPDPHGVVDIIEILAIRGVAVAILDAAISLVLVELCFRLIDLDAAAAARDRPATDEPSPAG
jgi:hypothetical protein